MSSTPSKNTEHEALKMAFGASLLAGCVIFTTLRILLLKLKIVKAVFAIILIAAKVVFKFEFDPRRFTLNICYILWLSKDLFAFDLYVKFNKLV